MAVFNYVYLNSMRILLCLFFSSNFSYNSNLYISLSFHFTCDINEEIIGFEVYLSIISNDVITDVVFCCFTHILQMVF